MISIERLIIQNFKSIKDLNLNFNQELNILVGNNETGKSTILESIDMVLTCKLYGKYLSSELSPYMFNMSATNEYLDSLRKGETPTPPSIFIELYLNDSPEVSKLKGTNNSLRTDSCGVTLTIEFDTDYTPEYIRYIQNPSEIRAIPIEYYKITWQDFAFNSITKRSLPVTSAFIDASTIRLQSGADYYIRKIIDNNLTASERAELSLDYRNLKEGFADKPYLSRINNVLIENPSILAGKELSISLDVSGKSSWESVMTTYLDNIPFSYIGQGDQSILKILLSLEKEASETGIVLIEEPENHLSFQNLNRLIKLISDKCCGKQLVISTHSTFVINKLGMNNLILLKEGMHTRLSELTEDTYDYFKKLPGYDTLRLILADKSILVEGPSDELIVQKAYYQKNKKLPIEDGIDVLSVRNLSFKRFLDIASKLEVKVRVVTDNDGNYQDNIVKKYEEYDKFQNIKICYSDDNSSVTLESQIVKVNDIDKLNKVLGKQYADKSAMEDYMRNNKTECALRIFEAQEEIEIPDYIKRAITIE
ncbi:MAG: AAA family ATPase [Candidatus Cloacimonadaceae bacterium]|nr:AAA family ATPase [Candidatus Cloacimonadaceae bacterium]